MNVPLSRRSLLLALALLPCSFAAAPVEAAHAQIASPLQAQPGILKREQASAILPDKVFYRGQSAPVQARNSGGVRFADSKLMLAAMVDTSGYSSTVQETYQAYLITEVPLVLGGKTLAPGAYGFGFIANDRMVVMDLGANEVMSTTTTRDPKLARPNPLQILPDPESTSRYRLYLGRNFISFEAAAK